MTKQSVFRLGAVATLMVAMGFTFGELIYFFGAAHSVLFSWIFFIVGILEVFMIITLYSAQVKRGNLYLLIGFVLLVIHFIVALMNQMGDLGVDTGLLSQAQLEKSSQITIFVVLTTLEMWTWPLGFVIFGFGAYRAMIFPRMSALLLILLGVTNFFRDFSMLIEYFFAALALVTFGWLGLLLWKASGAAEIDAQPVVDGLNELTKMNQ